MKLFFFCGGLITGALAARGPVDGDWFPILLGILTVCMPMIGMWFENKKQNDDQK